jgi:hypothetical protein
MLNKRELHVTIGRMPAVAGRRNKEDVMARKTVFVSDLTGQEIAEKDAAKVTITYSDARRGQVVLDVNADEVADLAARGTKQARRGRKPKAAA